MKAKEELIAMQHEVCLKKLSNEINRRLSELYAKRENLENCLNDMRIAVEACGDTIICRMSEFDIVNTTVDIFQQLDEVNAQIAAVKNAISYLQLDSQVGILKG